MDGGAVALNGAQLSEVLAADGQVSFGFGFGVGFGLVVCVCMNEAIRMVQMNDTAYSCFAHCNVTLLFSPFLSFSAGSCCNDSRGSRR